MADKDQTEVRAKFSVGQIIRHKLFGYRGVIVDVDSTFNGTEEWYEQMARTRPPKDAPWYHVLVDDQAMETYVAERNLEADEDESPIHHPALDIYFDGMRGGRYIRRMAN
ncbi:MAG: heat shock protein HspQ [Deltaproteobacteria bacterium]|nr:heat shock protein HspQ [Deltaproteobacteria bacterium]